CYEDANDILEIAESFLSEVLDEGGDMALLELVDEIFGLVCVALEGLDYVAGDIAYVADDVVGAEEATDDVSKCVINFGD
ncbi:MAG: hypothetical protein Q9201_006409, partial [Fulgogasparrea decipioides]